MRGVCAFAFVNPYNVYMDLMHIIKIVKKCVSKQFPHNVVTIHNIIIIVFIAYTIER